MLKPLPVRGKRAIDRCRASPAWKRTDLWREGDEVVFEQRSCGMPHAYIPFTPDRQKHLDVINHYLHGQGIYPIGRFGEWKYVNQDGAILSARRVVESVRSGETPRPRRPCRPSPGESTGRPDRRHTPDLRAVAGGPRGELRLAANRRRPGLSEVSWRRFRGAFLGSNRLSPRAGTDRPARPRARCCPWVRLGAGRRYFETEDGRPFLVIGQNDALTWPELEGLLGRRDVPSVERHLAWLAAHGVTTLRVMLEYVGDGLYLERSTGRVSTAR